MPLTVQSCKSQFVTFREVWQLQLFVVWILDNTVSSDFIISYDFVIRDTNAFWISVYMNLGPAAGTTMSLKFEFTGAATTRTWEIKVSQMECGALYT